MDDKTRCSKYAKNTDDGYNVKEKSNKKLPFICPHCKNELYKTVSFVSRSGLSCNYCGDTYSYPNRFMTNLLNILNVDFVNEFMIEPYKYKYDFMFVHNSKKYFSGSLFFLISYNRLVIFNCVKKEGVQVREFYSFLFH